MDITIRLVTLLIVFIYTGKGHAASTSEIRSSSSDSWTNSKSNADNKNLDEGGGDYENRAKSPDANVEQEGEKETPVDEHAQEAAADDGPGENAPVNEDPEENAPANDAPEENAPANDAPEENAPANGAPEENGPPNYGPDENAPGDGEHGEGEPNQNQAIGESPPEINNEMDEAQDAYNRHSPNPQNPRETDNLASEREKNVQINDLPERPDEDMVAIIERLSYLLQIEIQPHNIQAVYRVRAAPGRIRPVVIEFHDRSLRNRILLAGRRAHLSATDFYVDEVSRPVYVNEPLSSYQKKLLYEAKRIAKEKGYKYVWFRNSEVRMRKTEEADAIVIRTFEELETI